jgi:predicted GNAT family acetyltransferase
MTSELERAFAFEDALQDAAAERIERVPLGKALFNDSLPLIWSLNFLRVEAGDVGAEEIASEADRLQSRAGLEHRRVVIAAAERGSDLEPAFTTLGWKTDHFVFMVARDQGMRNTGTSTVEEIEAAAAKPLRETILREWLTSASDEVVRQLGKADRILERAGKARHFAVVEDGVAVSAAKLYSDGRTAQIEDVATDPGRRRRGYATAVVQRALEEARAAGHDFVFLVADARDWPQEMYRRLGFDPIGERYAFLRSDKPP